MYTHMYTSLFVVDGEVVCGGVELSTIVLVSQNYL